MHTEQRAAGDVAARSWTLFGGGRGDPGRDRNAPIADHRDVGRLGRTRRQVPFGPRNPADRGRNRGKPERCVSQGGGSACGPCRVGRLGRVNAHDRDELAVHELHAGRAGGGVRRRDARGILRRDGAQLIRAQRHRGPARARPWTAGSAGGGCGRARHHHGGDTQQVHGGRTSHGTRPPWRRPARPRAGRTPATRAILSRAGLESSPGRSPGRWGPGACSSYRGVSGRPIEPTRTNVPRAASFATQSPTSHSSVLQAIENPSS